MARPATITLEVLSLVTIVGGAVGEWGYDVFGSVAEAALLVVMIRVARAWDAEA